MQRRRPGLEQVHEIFLALGAKLLSWVRLWSPAGTMTMEKTNSKNDNIVDFEQ